MLHFHFVDGQGHFVTKFYEYAYPSVYVYIGQIGSCLTPRHSMWLEKICVKPVERYLYQRSKEFSAIALRNYLQKYILKYLRKRQKVVSSSIFIIAHFKSKRVFSIQNRSWVWMYILMTIF